MDFNKNYYLILGLTNVATTKEIKKAYYTLSFKYHPDKGGDPILFSEITLAYDILMDEFKRGEYDKKSKWGNNYDEYYALLDFDFQVGAETFDTQKMDNFKKNEILDVVVDVDASFNGVVEYERWIICKSCNGTGKDLKSKLIIKDDEGNIKGIFDPDDGCDLCEGTGKDYTGNKCGFCFGNGKIGMVECGSCKGDKRILGKQKASGIILSNDKLTKVEFMGNFSKDEPGKVGHLWLRRL